MKQIEQKQKIGLINPNWEVPTLKEIIPVLIISEYNCRSTAKTKFNEIMNICREKFGENFLQKIRTYNYTTEKGLTPW